MLCWALAAGRLSPDSEGIFGTGFWVLFPDRLFLFICLLVFGICGLKGRQKGVK